MRATPRAPAPGPVTPTRNCWLTVAPNWCRYDPRTVAAGLRGQLRALGPMSFREKLVFADFVGLATLWVTRDPKFIPGWGALFPAGYVTDGTPRHLPNGASRGQTPWPIGDGLSPPAETGRRRSRS